MKTEQKSWSKKVVTKKLSNDSDKVENVEKKQHESNVSVFTKSTNPKVVVWAEKLNEKSLYYSKLCSWKIMKLVFMVVMSILLIITFFVSLKTYHIVEHLSTESVSQLN